MNEEEDNSNTIETKLKNLLFVESEITNDILNLSENRMVDKIVQEIYHPTKETIETGYYEIKSAEIFGMKASIGTMSSDLNRERQFFNDHQKENLELELRISAIQIYWLLKGIKNYQLCYYESSDKIKNYYNSKDWTALLQTREGKIIDVLTGDICEQEKTDDTKTRIVKQTLDKLGFTYHGVNDFLLYMNKEGMIEPGKYNEIFTKNLIKTVYLYVKPLEHALKSEILQEGSTKYTDKETPFQRFHILACKKKTFGEKVTLIEEAKIKYVESAIKSFEQDISIYIPYKDLVPTSSEDKEIGVYKIGQLSNTTLAGIKGGVEVQLIKVKDIIKENKKNKEYLNLEFQATKKYYQDFKSKGGFKFNGRGEYCD